MRLPRVHFTLKSLIATIAIVAANCFTIRQWGDAEGAEFIIGGLPLINVALIGSARWLLGRVRRDRSRSSGEVNRSLPAFIYFALNLLILLGLITFLIPTTVVAKLSESAFLSELISSVNGICSEMLDMAEQLIDKMLPEPLSDIARTVLEAMFCFLVVSGPPLLLAWFGHCLANRCAALLTRRRLRVIVWVATLLFALADLAVCLTFEPVNQMSEVTLEVSMVNQATSQPVADASVSLYNAFWYKVEAPDVQAVTDAKGVARLRKSFEVVVQRNVFQSLTNFSTWGYWLRVSAPGYSTRIVPLPEVLGDVALASEPVRGRVTLALGDSPEPRFGQIAGFYGRDFVTQHGHPTFRIVSDGRFFWDASSGADPNSREYGHVRFDGDTIEFIPIARPGTGPHPNFSFKWRLITWGKQAYLYPDREDALFYLCRIAFVPDQIDDWYTGYPRRPTVPRMGIPQLPSRVWLAFFAHAIKGWYKQIYDNWLSSHRSFRLAR